MRKQTRRRRIARCRTALWLLLAPFVFQLTPAGSSSIARRFASLQTIRAPVARKPVISFSSSSRFTDLDRTRAVARGLNYIYRTSHNRRDFAEYGSDYLWCFYTFSVAARDEQLKKTARRMGLERASWWRRRHRALPRNADADTVVRYLFASDHADSLGIRDDRLKEQIKCAAAHYTARDYLLFNPLAEPPPTDVPEECEYDGAINPRGSKRCHVCRRRLEMRSRYDVWCDALITTYFGEHYGVQLGARYADVLKWLPVMRPYRGNENGANPDFFYTVYAVTHVIYTLNDYTQYRLSPTVLPLEYQFLKNNLREAIEEKDPDMLGEFMDTLMSFGLTSEDPDMRAGIEYLLSHQRRDGSWGDKDIHDRYHATWTAINGLMDYEWRAGEGLTFPEVKSVLERVNR
jgi:hypothetical protein